MTPTMDDVVARITSTPGCSVLPPAGLPQVKPPHLLPPDMRRFYELCGGAVLYGDNRVFALTVLPPSEVIVANAALFHRDDFTAAEWTEFEREVSWNWYLLADSGNTNYLVIDLTPEHLGLCYHADHESYPTPGETAIVARSLTELLWKRLTEEPVDFHYWEEDTFQDYGEAYAGYGQPD